MYEYYLVSGRGDSQYVIGEDAKDRVLRGMQNNPFIHSISVYKMTEYYERDDDDGWEV